MCPEIGTDTAAAQAGVACSYRRIPATLNRKRSTLTLKRMQALPAAIAAYLRPAGRQLDPWKDTMSCRVDVSHVFKEMLSASKLRAELQGQGAALPIFENAVGSVYRLTTAQVWLYVCRHVVLLYMCPHTLVVSVG